ncbi:MAG TPA: glycosyltransferase family 1 protein [Bryobacteraceae bacterium]|nr:glycosyltransferase family 1 protein [Bryobacteraceae bacterium]
MRIAIEAATLALASGGLARYTNELTLALANCFPEDEFLLVADRAFPMPAGAPANLKRAGGPRNAMERRWWLWGLERALSRSGAELIHGPDFAVPYLARRPSVLTLHDLSPWMDPRWHFAAGRVARRAPILMEMGIATMVITPGEQVRKQALERFHLRPERVVVVPEAAAPWLRPVVGAPETPYFLYVGAIEPRKNLPALVEAWREVRKRRPVELWLAGQRRADGPRIDEEPGLRLLGEVPDEQLGGLYSGALAFVYPSLYEGFGLPVMEAMQCGAPVIASSAVAEAAGSAAVYAEGPMDLAEAMARFASDAEWREEWRALSLARAKQFSWERTARLTREVYREACARFDS